MIKYAIHIHWGNFKKYPPREGILPEINPEQLNGRALTDALEQIFMQEQNEVTSRPIPSASVDDIIEIGIRRYAIKDIGFAQEN